MKRTLLFVLALFFAGNVFASNMGFKANINRPSSASNKHWVSLPYFYTPADVNTSSSVDSEDLLSDMTGAITVFKFDSATNQKIGYTLGGYDAPFTLTKGEAYELINDGANTISFISVGSHDDAFSHNYPTTASNKRWISVPWHWNPADVNTNSQRDSEDLLTEMDGAITVFRFDTATNQKIGYTLGGYDTPFTIDVFQGYEVINDGASTITWTPSHF